MFKSLFLVFFSALVLSAAGQKGFTIHAKITGFPDGTKFYLVDPEIQTSIDSAIIKKNGFRMKGILGETPRILHLRTNVAQESYYTYFFIGNEGVTITGDKKDFPFFLSVKGSVSQDEYQVLNDQINKWYQRRQKLTDVAVSLMWDTTAFGKALHDSVWRVIRPIDKLTDSIRISFIQSNLNSYAGLNELNFLKSRFNKTTLQKMYDTLKTPYKESVYGMRLWAYLEVGDPIKKGDSFFDFEAVDTAGKKYELSAFKGKYILLDFVQANCGPCILSVDELKEMNSLYKNKLTIISFNTDQSRDIWYKSILRDKPTWLSLWDGNGTYGRAVLKYGVNGYPTSILINPDGKVVWVGSGWGEGTFTNLLSKYINGVM
jgi:thiol-disulfide isomerase/thioredoxin